MQGTKKNLKKKTEEAKNAHKIMYYSFSEYNAREKVLNLLMKPRFPLRGKENPFSINM